MADSPAANVQRRFLALFIPAEPALKLSMRRDRVMTFKLLAFSFFALVFWARAGVLLHEAAGHALVWTVQGGDVLSLEVTLFGGGRVRTEGEAASGAWLFAFRMAGILVNGLMGAALAAVTWMLLRRERYEWAFGGSWGAVVNLAGATHYSAVGAFYGYGDSGPYPWLWIPSFLLLLSAMPLGVHLWARSYVELTRQADTAPVAGRARPGLSALLVVFLSLAAYAAGLWGEQATSSQRTEFATLRAERVAIAREMARLRDEKARLWRQLHGDEPIPEEFLEVASDEIEKPFPFLPLVLFLDALLILAALARPLRTRSLPEATGLTSRALAVAGVSSLIMLVVCHFVF